MILWNIQYSAYTVNILAYLENLRQEATKLFMASMSQKSVGQIPSWINCVYICLDENVQNDPEAIISLVPQSGKYSGKLRGNDAGEVKEVCTSLTGKMITICIDKVKYFELTFEHIQKCQKYSGQYFIFSAKVL